MKVKKTNLARAAMMLLLAVLTTTVWAQTVNIFAGFTATGGTGGTGNEGYAKLVDGKFSPTDWTKWGTSDMDTPPGEEGEYYWVDFHSEQPIYVVGYILTTGNDNAESEEDESRNPKSWVLKAKLNEGDVWTTIATVTNDSKLEDVNHTSYEYDLDEGKSGKYQYFRFMISETKGSYFMQLDELRLKGYSNEADLEYATISGLLSSYLYTGNAISISYTVTAADGTALNSTDHYDAVITKDGNPVTEVKEFGTYTLTITGKGDYTGTKSVTFKVVNEIMIGNSESTATQYFIPVNMWYKHSLTQQIYTADEIGTAGTINAISFDYTHTAAFSLNSVQVFLMQVDKDAFESNTDMVALDNATEVYNGIFAANGAGWATIDFDTPFNYDGNSNLLVCLYYPNSEDANYLGGSYRFRTTATEDYLAISYYSDSAVPSLENVSTFSGSKGYYQYHANIKLDIIPEPGTDCSKPTSITVSGISLNGATVTWESDGDAWNLRYKADGDADYTLVEGLTSNTYPLSNLADNTNYSVGVQTVCSEESVSLFRTTTFTTSNSCAAPTNLVVSNLTTTSATLSWTAGYQETSWTVKYKEASDSEYITETVSSPTITLSGLKGLTAYDVQIYNCTGENDAYLSGTFTTAMGLPLNEEFGITSIPTGWAQYSGLLNSVMEGTATLASTSYGWSFGNHNGVFDSHARVNIYGSSCNKWLVMPSVSMEDNVQLSFEMAYTAFSGTAADPAQTGTDDKFVVLISTDNMATWTILRQWDNAEGSDYVLNDLSPTPVVVTLDLSSYAGQCVNVAFYGESTESNADNNLHIDNVSIDYISDCAKPTLLKVSNVTAHTAQLSWTSDASAWQICLNGDEDNIIDATENPYTLEDLTDDTDFTAKVRTSCGGDSYSEWSNEVSFTTPQACPAPTDLEVSDITGHKAKVSWTGSSDSYIVSYRTALTTDGIYEEFNTKAFPAHWSKYSGLVDDVLDGTAELVTTSSSSSSSGWYTTTYALGEYNMKLNIYGSGTRYWLVTPEFTASQDLTFDLALTDYYNANPIEDDTAQDDDRFVVLVYADEAWHILREWNNSGSTYVYNDISNTGENVSIALTDYYGMDVKIAFYGESTVSNNGDNDLHIDNVISGIPTPAGEWQTVTIEDNTCTLTGLLPMTDYEVKVEGACEGEQGHVTEMVSFTTDVACIAPSGLAAAKVGPESFELSWTENGETTAWQIQVNEEEPIDVTENPYTVTGLEPETEYSVKVRANGGDDGYSEWTYSITVTTLVTNPVPFDLAVSDITPTTATVSWTGFSDSYNVYLGTDDITNLFSADFDNQAIPADWITEDTYPWTVVVYDGGYCIQSSNAGESSSTSSISVTKTYSMDGTIEFDAQCMGEGTSSAYDKCVFSIDGVAQFANGKNGEQWDHYTFDVTEGEHTFTWSYSKDSSVNPDGDYFAVDNVVMNGVNTVWNEPIAVTDTEYTFDELTHGTTYRVKVEAVNGEDISEASEVVRFTTLETVSITFAKEGYSTYYNSQRVVVLPAGMKARIVTAQDNNKLTYETIADGDGDTKTVVPATAMMLQVAPTDVSQVIDITLTKAPAMYTQRTDNLLHGSDVATTTTGNADDARFYKLSYNKSGTDIGWYWGTADGSPFTSAAHKAWLALPEAAAGARNFLSLPDFSDSQANTSIDDMPTAVDNVDGTWYSIDGVKLDGQPTRKGLYIVNGQKKVVK